MATPSVQTTPPSVEMSAAVCVLRRSNAASDRGGARPCGAVARLRQNREFASFPRTRNSNAASSTRWSRHSRGRCSARAGARCRHDARGHDRARAVACRPYEAFGLSPCAGNATRPAAANAPFELSPGAGLLRPCGGSAGGTFNHPVPYNHARSDHHVAVWRAPPHRHMD
jgi:hypothetical protein